MNAKSVGNAPEKVFLVVRNDESSTISRGTPVALQLDGTDDGLAVILPSTSAAKAHAVAFGVAAQDIASGTDGQVQVFGFCNYAKIVTSTRAASTDSFATVETQALGCILNISTVANAFISSGGTLAVTGYLPFAVLAQSMASTVGIASTTSDTSLRKTTSAKVFLRMM